MLSEIPSDHIIIPGLIRPGEIGQCDIAEVIGDQIVQPLPHLVGAAVCHAGAGGRIGAPAVYFTLDVSIYAFDRGKGNFTTKYIFQFARILAFCFLGEILHVVLPLPVPASVYGLVLLLAALNFKLVKLDDVKEVGTYLTGIFPLLFVPAAAGVMELWAEMGEMLLPILVAIIPVTVLVMVSAGKTTQALTGRKKKEADNDAAAE